ncbi:hypothetical protein Nepgr_020158 [Nepenthes gracilis]|uniref:Uncharacterized protein n=1 Tax=Nepenthes gracilis TaxID=150966 RepID=A0AAD3SXL4_NEPGR|nr:hypothetical protein Nepgr_020158 [Nepenthes gracilis]
MTGVGCAHGRVAGLKKVVTASHDALLGNSWAHQSWVLLAPGIVIRPASGHGAPRGDLPAGRGPVLVGESRAGDLLAMMEGRSQWHIFRLLQSVPSLCG